MYNRDLQEAEKLGIRKWVGVHYYDHPDGEDLFGKLSYVLKYTTAAGILGGLLFIHPKYGQNTVDKTVNVLRVVVPFVASGFTFTCVTFYITRFRQKDDELNYIIGGAAAGAACGACFGKSRWAASGALYFSFAAFLQKYSQLRGLPIFPKTQVKQFSPYVHRQFATLGKSPADQYPPTWTK